jgi:hypothetical protein
MSTPNIATPSSALASAPTGRSSKWTCRLPAELLGFVCEALMNDRDYHALSTLSRTSSATYTTVHPYLFRHLDLDFNDAIDLFALFGNFSRTDNLKFWSPIPNDVHLLDLHLAHRLRVSLAHTLTLSLRVDSIVDRKATDYEEDTDRYKELMSGLSAFGGPMIWRSLQRCEINLNPTETIRYNDNYFIPSNYAPLMEIAFAKLHPKHLSITLPDVAVSLTGGNDQRLKDWGCCMTKLHADHIEIIDYSPALLKDLPQASSTLTIRHKVWDAATEAVIRNGLDDRIRGILGDSTATVSVDSVRLVGLLRQSPDDSLGLFSETVALETIAQSSGQTMWRRGYYHNNKDLKLAILPDTSPASEAAAVWHTYKAGTRVSFPICLARKENC